MALWSSDLSFRYLGLVINILYFKTQTRLQTLVLIGAVLFWLQTMWTLALNIVAFLPVQIQYGINSLNEQNLAQSIGFYYLNFVALVLLYAAAVKSAIGLWTAAGTVPSTISPSPAIATGFTRQPFDELDGNPRFQQQHKAELAAKSEPVAPAEMQQQWQQQYYQPSGHAAQGPMMAQAPSNGQWAVHEAPTYYYQPSQAVEIGAPVWSVTGTELAGSQVDRRWELPSPPLHAVAR
ncbi:uncharacterized protein B0I36DRAFT_388371 [Microdochium trichocladiopsis]|uniref:Uncharacterized protein n=1 Tax=Microdochium trichocladiopsis TaxID=1682393 RepID=A0A9P8XUF4_9PEZI|nr:uncharacterized protein B0I36DRAFT_388371 [Microdochium trichocladiopsis]KAH7018100.1 hypothetical protein B0I36DRAFT_388371 [Microdochium trichocladiopsis]